MIRQRTATSVAAAARYAVLLAGCTAASNIGPAGSTSSADDTITEIAAADRGDPIVFAGKLEDDAAANSTDWLGSVVVNFWYAACPPCRAEAPDLRHFMSSSRLTVWSSSASTSATAPLPRPLTLADDRVNTRCGEYRLGLGESVGTFDPPATASTRRALIYKRWDTH